MKKGGKRIVSLITIGLVVTLCFISLFGCTKKKTQGRQKAIASIENSIVKIYDESYTADKSDIEKTKMKDPGKYIVAKAWAEFYSTIINKSKLQTGKVEKIAKMISNQNIVGALDKIDILNQELFSSFKELDLNSADVSSLYLEFINEITTSNFAERHYNNSKGLLPITKDNRSLANGLAVLEDIKNSIDIINEDKETIASIKKNSSKIEKFIKAIYQMGDHPISQRVISLFSEGKGSNKKIFTEVFKDSTKDEIKTYFKQMLDSAIELYNEIDWAQNQQVSKDVKNMTNRFKEALFPSALISDAINYLDVINNVMEFANFQKDILEEFKKALDDDGMNVMDDIYEVVKSNSEDAETFLMIPLAKVINKIASETDAQQKIKVKLREQLHKSNMPQGYSYASHIIATMFKNLSGDGTVDTILSQDIMERSLRKAYVRKANKRNLELIKQKFNLKSLDKWHNGIDLENINGVYNDCAKYVGMSEITAQTNLSREDVRKMGREVRRKIDETLASTKPQVEVLIQSIVDEFFGVVKSQIEELAKLNVTDEGVKGKIEEINSKMKEMFN